MSVGASGTAPLSYLWSELSGPAAVTFGVNGSPSAQATTVSLSAAGTYVLQVAVTDGLGLTTVATMTSTTKPAMIARILLGRSHRRQPEEPEEPGNPGPPDRGPPDRGGG